MCLECGREDGFYIDQFGEKIKNPWKELTSADMEHLAYNAKIGVKQLTLPVSGLRCNILNNGHNDWKVEFKSAEKTIKDICAEFVQCGKTEATYAKYQAIIEALIAGSDGDSLRELLEKEES